MNNLLFEESVSEFEKTAAEKTDINDIIEISDTEKKNDSTIVSMKRTSTSFKHKTLSLIALKLSKHIQISEQSISISVKISDESSNLNKYNLNTVQAVQKELNKIAEFINVVSAAENIMTNNYFFKLLSEMCFSDLVNKRLSVNIAF
ncbi:uncharacterized protein BDCG_09229 [Blastomyces dermatitidis ER-3]|uniref:Uncharacterized protein n=1 Tax=Ajellomyces dermatitidis (strain ER-3 / ATCC MYA-2586) TaxID=559297 RepID=A0ABP2EQQ5_AJEDR|nr:uncharacterized protein BDCG_09229 [Blastomyces dermatitidis ER-3]EEQ85960.2 hypothetical protein BDCG_09229 [Blastomyces dermatitidis ER-3]